MKAAAVHYLGGKCVVCGKTGHPVIFDFHHPGQKDFSISEAGTIAWARVKKELDKCDLLCGECHRLEHTDFQGDFLAAAYDYKGPLDLGEPFLPE
jgi:hypothetical protein